MSIAIEELDFAETTHLPLVLQIQPVLDMTDDQFFDFCQLNRDLRIERNEEGELLIMSRVGGESSRRNLEIARQLANWAKRDKTGIAFDSSAGFRLAKRAMRSPDAAWVRLDRWQALSVKERKKFPPLCPDFVIELRSETDRLRTLQEKMRKYLANGASMGLLVDPLARKVHIYRQGQKTEVLEDPKTVSCEPLLRGFALDLRDIW